MKSTYGRQPSAPDYELACVEPVSPMGELMRRYWQPVCASDVKDCNWLQHYENIVGPHHLLMLHQWISGDQFEGALMQIEPDFTRSSQPDSSRRSATRGTRLALA